MIHTAKNHSEHKLSAVLIDLDVVIPPVTLPLVVPPTPDMSAALIANRILSDSIDDLVDWLRAPVENGMDLIDVSSDPERGLVGGAGMETRLEALRAIRAAVSRKIQEECRERIR